MAELFLFLEAFTISYLLTRFILSFSLKRNLLDIPNVRSSHTIPKPRLGGVALTVSFYVSCATLFLVGLRPFPSSITAAGILAGGAIIALLGLYDDLRGLDARMKLLAQLAICSIVIASGVVMEELTLPLIGTINLGALSVPFTVLWILGITNFYNFIDGIDGLAAGTGMIASSFLIVVGGMAGAPMLGGVYAILAGSCLGFLRYNFPPARIFMGDMGSTFIGYSFAVLSVMGSKVGIPAFLTILLLGAVLADAALTLIRRIVGREKVLSPHRTHYYQRLTALGLSHKQVTLLEYLIAVLLGVSALMALSGDRIFVTFFAIMWLGFFLWVLVKIRSMERGIRLFLEGRTLAVAIGDLIFIAGSYVLSYYLRLNFTFPQAETASLLLSLPLVLIIRSAVFFYFGLYRGVWRYTTFDDIMRIVKAVTLSSLVMIVSFTLLFRFEAFPRSVFIIDWFILTVFLSGSRIATRWFHELPSREELSGKRVAIAGTGPIAELILHHIKKTGGMKPVGYLDDRAETIGRMIHGLEVFGPISESKHIAQLHEIEEIIVMGSLLNRFTKEVLEELNRSGVTLRVISDPSELEAIAVGHPLEAPVAGRRVLAAGNGIFVGSAGSLFSRASEIILISHDSRALGASRTVTGTNAERDSIYIGIMNDRRSLREVLERHKPEFVFIDFAFTCNGLSNPLEAYLRTVLLPAERLASEVLKIPDVRMIAVNHAIEGDQSGLAEAVCAFGILLREIFKHEPDRLSILTVGFEPAPGWWLQAVRDLERQGGGTYRATDRDGAVIESETSPEPVPDVELHLIALRQSLDEGDSEGIIEILRGMVRSHAFEKYGHGNLT